MFTADGNRPYSSGACGSSRLRPGRRPAGRRADRRAGPAAALLGAGFLFALGVPAGGPGCTNHKPARPPEAGTTHTALPAARLLGLTPAGPDFFVWIDLDAFRRWPFASDLSGPRTGFLSARIERFRASWGIDPFRHIDQLVYAAKLTVPDNPAGDAGSGRGTGAGASPTPTAPLTDPLGRTIMLAQGPGLRNRLYGSAPRILAGRGRMLTRAYRHAAVIQAGRAALAFPDPDLVVSSDPVTVLRCVDLARKRREESVADSPSVLALWRRIAGIRAGGKPAAILAAVLPGALAARLKDKLRLDGPLLRLAARIQVGEWVQVTVLAEFHDVGGARSAVRRAKEYVDGLSANPYYLKANLRAFTRYLQVHNEGRRTYLQYHIPSEEFQKLARTLGSVGLKGLISIPPRK